MGGGGSKKKSYVDDPSEQKVVAILGVQVKAPTSYHNRAMLRGLHRIAAAAAAAMVTNFTTCLTYWTY
jgi:hypothetical protein